MTNLIDDRNKGKTDAEEKRFEPPFDPARPDLMTEEQLERQKAYNRGWQKQFAKQNGNRLDKKVTIVRNLGIGDHGRPIIHEEVFVLRPKLILMRGDDKFVVGAFDDEEDVRELFAGLEVRIENP